MRKWFTSQTFGLPKRRNGFPKTWSFIKRLNNGEKFKTHQLKFMNRFKVALTLRQKMGLETKWSIEMCLHKNLSLKTLQIPGDQDKDKSRLLDLCIQLKPTSFHLGRITCWTLIISWKASETQILQIKLLIQQLFTIKHWMMKNLLKF